MLFFIGCFRSSLFLVVGFNITHTTLRVFQFSSAKNIEHDRKQGFVSACLWLVIFPAHEISGSIHGAILADW